jgi:Leucine-rich repeat (LRR) protein
MDRNVQPDHPCSILTHFLFCVVLSENLLYGQIPTELSSMASLQVFSVFRKDKSGPRLSGSLPGFHRVPQLTDLYLQGNELQGTIPKDFLSASLKAALVKLGSNLLTGAVPSELAALTALTLQLEDNQIAAFPEAFCEKRDWMDGAIAAFGCDAFLCPPGSSSPEGRTKDEATTCVTCSQANAAPYYGTTSCDGPPTDRDVLINLYYATGGDSWTRNDFWGSTADVCDWYGIACVSGQVVEINLRANNLVGLPPPDLFYLRGLQILWLYSNPIKFSFENIGSAVSLQDLRLDGTHLHSLHGVGAARSLIALDVRFTDIKGTFPQEILQLTNLRSLSMSGNRLNGNLPSSFAALKFLVSLRLDSNQFSGRLPSFDDMHFTRYLDLSQNALTGALSKNVFGKVTETEQVTLNLAGNQITGVVPEELDRFTDVTMYLRDNRILGLPLLLCDNGDWNGGDVGNFGCDAILCKPGTFNKYGRYRPGSRCSPCSTARYYGLSSCPPSAGSRIHLSLGLGAALVGGPLLLQLVV